MEVAVGLVAEGGDGPRGVVTKQSGERTCWSAIGLRGGEQGWRKEVSDEPTVTAVVLGWWLLVRTQSSK